MINSDSFLLTSGLILTLLISATVISYTSKFIFVSDKLKKSTNQIYDPDHGLNATAVCILSKDPYATSYERSPCFNKTLLQWYNPWLRGDLWNGFWREITARRRLEELKRLQEQTANNTEIPIANDTVLPTDPPQEKPTPEVQKVREEPNEFVYGILVGLIIISGMIACWEVCKDKLKKDGGAAAKAQDRECPLADFTINRHLRRESQQQSASHLPRQGSLELTAKVTQNLIHQSSLDRAFPKTISEAVTSQERRNSMPLYLSSDVQQIGSTMGTPTSTALRLCKRQSVDVPGEDLSSDLRKKPRHFIRRH